jgi:phage terminase large subunit-like protein
MARGEVTGKKPAQTADGPKYRRKPQSVDPNALAMSIHSFCVLHGISEDQFYKMQREKWGPTEKAAADHVPYDLWHSQGHLQATPGRTVSYEYVARHLRGLFQRYNIQKIGFDRWNMKHLRPWLLRAGFHEQMIEEHFVEFGQGVASMSPALRDLEQVLLEGELAHGGHPVLSMCVAHTVITLDDAGNRKPSKRKSTGRIDGLVALAMAVGVAPLQVPAIDVRSMIG